MELELTKRELREIYDRLSNLKHIQPNPKAGYALGRTRGKIKNVVDGIIEAAKFGEAGEWKDTFTAWNKDRDEAIKRFARDDEGVSTARQFQDPQGNASINRQVPPEKLGAYLDAIEELREKHKPVLDALDAHLKEFDKLLDGKEKMDVFQVKGKDIPKGLSQEDYNILYLLFEEPVDEKTGE